MVSEEIIKIASRYLSRDEEEIEEVFESIGIKTVEDLANADIETLAKALGVEKDTSAKMVAMARSQTSSTPTSKACNKKDDEAELPPYFTTVLLMWLARGITIPVVLGESFAGKSTMVRYICDVTVRSQGTLTPPGLAEALNEAKWGVLLDDLQLSRDPSLLTTIVRALAESKRMRGGNVRYEGRIGEVVEKLVEHKKSLAVTWDLSSKDLTLDKSDLKRALLLPPRPATIALPFPIKRFMVRGHCIPMKYREVEEWYDISDTRISRYYLDLIGTSDVSEEVYAVISVATEILKAEDADDVVSASYSNYRDVVDVYYEDPDSFDWWIDLTRELLTEMFPGVQASGCERVDFSAVLLYTKSVSSLIGQRYDWNISNYKEFEECAELTKKYMERALDPREINMKFIRQACRKMIRVGKELNPPF